MRILSNAELKARGIKYCNPHRIELERTGRFPRRVRLSERRYGYLEDEINDWIERRAALRGAS